MNRREFLRIASAAVLLTRRTSATMAQIRRKGVMLMNRIGPSSSELYIANADGSNERKFLQDSIFEYHPSYAPGGKWVLFTSERNGLGQSDIFRARPDGTGIEPVITSPAVDDAAVSSPDGSRIAFVSTRDTGRADIWILDVNSGRLHNLTGAPSVQGDACSPDGFFRPSWSPNSEWLVFSSDRNTEWRGHDHGRRWEHTQELSIYVVQAEGQGFRRIASKPGYCLGSPRWSPDGNRVVFYEMTTEETWCARRPECVVSVVSQIVSVDVATGERVEHTSGPGLKVFPHFLSGTELAYYRKGGPDEGIIYTSGRLGFKADLRSPTWSPDGETVIYEKAGWGGWTQNQQLYSFDPDWEYRYTDVFPSLSRDGKLAITEKNQNSSIAIMDPDGSNRKRIFDTADSGLNPWQISVGLAGAFAPAWSPDGQWIAFGLGTWFEARRESKATIMRVRRDGTGLERLTDGRLHSGFPSYSADGKQIVYRVLDDGLPGLRILNLEDRATRVLTTEYDNFPSWSPDGGRIVFTRKVDAVNFDIYTIRPDGTDLLRLTTNRANDAHAVWTADGRIMWNSGMFSFRDEAALYDNTFQPYGQIFIMNADGTDKRMLTDSLWEDAMPLYVPMNVYRHSY